MNRKFSVTATILSPCALILSLAAARAESAENLLKNPSFERNQGADSVPDGWEREEDPHMNPATRGPYALVKDAHQGTWAVSLETEHWNYLIPQRMLQEVKLPAGATMLRASAWAKGIGLFGLTVQFQKDGKPLAEKKINLGFGDLMAPVETEKAFALEHDYQPYAMELDVPEGADAVLFKAGNSVSIFGRDNVFGRAVIDSLSLVVERGAKTAEPKPSHQSQRTFTTPDDLTDIASSCRVRMTPPSLNPTALFDGNVLSSPSIYRGCERGVITQFRFHKRLRVQEVAIFCRSNVSAYSLRGDADGDGVCELVLDRTSGLSAQGWIIHRLPRTRLHAVQVQGIEGRLWGFRGTSHFIGEIRILVPEETVTKKELREASVYTLEPEAPWDTPSIGYKVAPMRLEKGPHPFRKMVCADLWMWGLTGRDYVKKEDLLKNRGFLQAVQDCKEMGIDTIFIDLTNSSCWDFMPWPSKVCKGMKEGENLLKELIAALHEKGLKAVTETLHNFTPFETVKWHYPCEETHRYPNMKQYPNVLFGNHVRDNWLTVYQEMIASGADGVCLGSDEFYYRGALLPALPKDDPAREAYRDRYGDEIPANEADTLAYRRWLALRNEALAKLFGFWSEQLKAQYPDLYTCSLFMQQVDKTNLHGGFPVDLVGRLGGIDQMGSDYMRPFDLCLLAAANGWRKTAQVFSGNMYSLHKEPPINLYGKPLWMLMYGGGSCGYWRYYQIRIHNSIDSVKHGYEMVDDLMALGVWDARPPRDLAVLTSRAGLDWWMVRAMYNPSIPPHTDRAVESRRGWFTMEFAVDRLLLKNGYPFRWKWLDHPDTLGDLSEHRVLLLPFPYSISDAAAAKVRDAVAKGSKLILLGNTGETDEWGEPRGVPAFRDLVANGRATLLNEDIFLAGGEDTFVRKARGLIDGALGETNPVRTELYGRNVDVTLLEKEGNEKFLFILNWEPRPASVDLSVAVPEGEYLMMMRDDITWHRVSLAGEDVFTSEMLKDFRVPMPPQQGRAFYLKPNEPKK